MLFSELPPFSWSSVSGNATLMAGDLPITFLYEDERGPTMGQFKAVENMQGGASLDSCCAEGGLGVGDGAQEFGLAELDGGLAAEVASQFHQPICGRAAGEIFLGCCQYLFESPRCVPDFRPLDNTGVGLCFPFGSKQCHPRGSGTLRAHQMVLHKPLPYN